jgi:hypothetical protein
VTIGLGVRFSLPLRRDPVGEHGGGFLTGDTERKGIVRDGCLSRGPNGEPNQPTKELTEGGDLREAQVDALGLYSHSCLDGIAGSVTEV